MSCAKLFVYKKVSVPVTILVGLSLLSCIHLIDSCSNPQFAIRDIRALNIKCCFSYSMFLSFGVEFYDRSSLPPTAIIAVIVDLAFLKPCWEMGITAYFSVNNTNLHSIWHLVMFITEVIREFRIRINKRNK